MSELVIKCEEQIKNNLDENLKVLRIIYATSFLLGMRELLLGFNVKEISLENFSWPHFIYLCGATVLLLLAIRLFWGVGNIRRFLVEKIDDYFSKFKGSQTPEQFPIESEKGIESKVLTAEVWVRVMGLDLPLMLSQSFIFFLLCELLPIAIFGSSEIEPLERMNEFKWLFFSILFVNIVWLLLLKTHGKTSSEYTWIKNNLFFLIFGILIFESFPQDNQWLYFSMILAWFFLNSVIDFVMTGWAYLVGPSG
ncbi:MAG: hypothetical protein R3B74_02900 [Nitrospirales bacterium]|nr:hypothetical protein [Nitrospirales bacterium]